MMWKQICWCGRSIGGQYVKCNMMILNKVSTCSFHCQTSTGVWKSLHFPRWGSKRKGCSVYLALHTFCMWANIFSDDTEPEQTEVSDDLHSLPWCTSPSTLSDSNSSVQGQVSLFPLELIFTAELNLKVIKNHLSADPSIKLTHQDSFLN